MSIMVRFASAACRACAVFAICAAPVATLAAPGKPLLARGAAIARNNCGACHAISRTGASPNPKSPPFRELARRYPLSNLEEALAEGIVVGHEGLEMPRFKLDAAEIEAILAYLGSIQKR
jgi:mono/diheme cytochrome c family protein